MFKKWNIFCRDENEGGKRSSIVNSTKTNSRTSQSGAKNSSPIGDFFMYLETSSNNQGDKLFVSFKRIDIIQICNKTFYFIRFSILASDSLKAMSRFGIQLLLEDISWGTRYNIPKNDRYNDSSTDLTLVSLNFTQESFGIKLFCDHIKTACADMCFGNFTITHSVY